MKLALSPLLLLLTQASVQAAPLVGGGNDDCTSATVLTAGTHTGFHASDHWYEEQSTHQTAWNTDHDWYRITLQPSEQLDVQMIVTNVTGQAAFVLSQVFERHPTNCVDPLVPAALHNSVVNNTSAPKDYVIDVFGVSALSQGDLDFDYDLVLQTTPVQVTSYCPGAINSLGASGKLTMQGSTSVADNDVRFVGSNVRPFTSALLFKGTGQTVVPFGDGTRCVNGTVHRLKVQQATPYGYWVGAVNLPSLPASAAIAPGSTWNFQLWYRDNNGPLNTGFNLTNGVTVTFAP